MFAMPSAKRCVSRRKFVIHVHRPTGVVLRSMTITVNRRTKVKMTGLKASRVPAKVSLRGLPKGKIVVKVVAVTTTGRKAVSTRRTAPAPRSAAEASGAQRRPSPPPSRS